MSVVRTVVVVGNPRAASRTAAAGVALARTVAPESTVEVIELSELTGGLFAWGDPAVAAAKGTVLAADLLVVASPVYKAAYTGLLKAFLDQFGRDELRALATVPLLVGAGPAHELAVEQQLRPVLVEIGASLPTRGVYILDSIIDAAGTVGTELGEQLEQWAQLWAPPLLAVANARTPAPTP